MMIEPPPEEAQSFGVLVAARMIYELYVTEQRSVISVIDSIENTFRSTTERVRRPAVARWEDLTQGQIEHWLERGRAVVEYIVAHEPSERRP